jgi:hypothetical protein
MAKVVEVIVVGLMGTVGVVVLVYSSNFEETHGVACCWVEQSQGCTI